MELYDNLSFFNAGSEPSNSPSITLTFNLIGTFSGSRATDQGLVSFAGSEFQWTGTTVPFFAGAEDDNRVYECAAAAKAHYIVTENTRHFKEAYKTTKAVTARQLLQSLEADQA